MTEVPTASWRATLSDAQLAALYAELKDGVPNAGVAAVPTPKKHMSGMFETRHTHAATILGIQADDYDWHTTWDAPQNWWYQLARTISPFAETLPTTWPPGSRPEWLQIIEDTDIRVHIPLSAVQDPFPMCHCNICYPTELVKQHLTDGAAVARMAMCNAYDVHMHAQCTMHLDAMEAHRQLMVPPAAASAASVTGALSSFDVRLRQVEAVLQESVQARDVLVNRVAALEAELEASCTAFQEALSRIQVVFEQSALKVLLPSGDDQEAKRPRPQ
jgi:hypothetical protein